MLAVKDGDVEPFAVLFDRYHQRLYEFFYRLGSSAALSEDLVQEVFLRMLKYRNTFRADSEFRGWMYHIARTVRIDRFRAQRQEVGIETEAIGVQSGEVSPDGYVQERERAELLRQALLRLPEDRRELLILARFQELKYEQIGLLLGIDAGAVKVRVHRAMAELREIVREMSEERSKCTVKKPGNLLRTN
ncbi:MAG TPA: sigma-70 family RNA polymerase sigma factor [Terriglobia bacterium]|nr:sigma-70 family RNA polymerase sigma factor [Terriglobia bacterium]